MQVVEAPVLRLVDIGCCHFERAPVHGVVHVSVRIIFVELLIVGTKPDFSAQRIQDE